MWIFGEVTFESNSPTFALEIQDTNHYNNYSNMTRWGKKNKATNLWNSCLCFYIRINFVLLGQLVICCKLFRSLRKILKQSKLFPNELTERKINHHVNISLSLFTPYRKKWNLKKATCNKNWFIIAIFLPQPKLNPMGENDLLCRWQDSKGIPYYESPECLQLYREQLARLNDAW